VSLGFWNTLQDFPKADLEAVVKELETTVNNFTATSVKSMMYRNRHTRAESAVKFCLRFLAVVNKSRCFFEMSEKQVAEPSLICPRNYELVLREAVYCRYSSM